MIPSFIYRTIYQSDYYVVKQNWCHRWLSQPDGTIHSRLNRCAKHKPELEYMIPMLRLCNKNSGDYLMLGLGGGAILHSLEYKLTKPNFDVVEINPEIISIAKQFFFLDSLKSTVLFEEDANHYIERCNKNYDAILIDLYQDRTYPKHCVTQSFFQNCKRLLKSEGLVIINCANMAQYPDLLKGLRSVFNQSVLTIRIKHPRNVILVASIQPIKDLIDNLPLKNLGWHAQTGLVSNLNTE